MPRRRRDWTAQVGRVSVVAVPVFKATAWIPGLRPRMTKFGPVQERKKRIAGDRQLLEKRRLDVSLSAPSTSSTTTIEKPPLPLLRMVIVAVRSP